jgi:hypothetical protein
VPDLATSKGFEGMATIQVELGPPAAAAAAHLRGIWTWGEPVQLAVLRSAVGGVRHPGSRLLTFQTIAI